MDVYIGLFMCIILIYFLSKKTNNSNKYFLIFTGILLVIVIGSRHSWYSFSDEGMYYLEYKNAIGKTYNGYIDSFGELKDVGYFTMTWLLAQIVPWPQFLLYLECAAIVGATFYFLYKNTRESFLGVMVFLFGGLFTFYMSAFRQGFAFAFCLLAYQLDENRRMRVGIKKIWFLVFEILIVIVSISMHRSAIIFLGIIVAKNIKYTNIKYLLFVVLTGYIFLFPEQILYYGNSMTDSDYGVGTATSLSGFWVQIFIYIFPLIIQGMTRYRMRKKNDFQLNNIIIASSLGIVFYIFRLYSLVFERIAFYYLVFPCALYDGVVQKGFEKKSQKIFYFVFSLGIMLLFLDRVSGNRFGGDFTFFWQVR